MPRKYRLKLKNTVFISFNLIAVLSIILLFLVYNYDYQDKLHMQNINDITNLNQSSASIASTVFINRQNRLDEISKYIKLNNFTLEETLKYICDTSADGKSNLQLVGTDYKGYAAIEDENGYTAVDYTDSTYKSLRPIFRSTDVNNDRINLTMEFTDNITAVKCFALYSKVMLATDGEPVPYTLLSVEKTAYFIDLIHVDGGFEKTSNVICDYDGNYIISSASFKSTNLFQYFYIYNDLSYDQKQEIMKTAQESDNGVFYYKNSLEDDCVYVYAKIPDTDWYSVSCVPIKSFRSSSFDLSFTFIIICIFAVLLVADIIWLTGLNHRLRTSAEEARIASSAKTDFLSRMSHDIRTPLNVITGMTTLALKNNNSDETNEYLHNIASSGKFLMGLVNDILDLNKVESGGMELHPAPYTYVEFERYIHAVILPLCEAKNVHFFMETTEMPKAVFADSLRLNQIFFNLLSNAVKFTPANGKVSFTVSNSSVAPDGTLDAVFTISDTGIGMSKEFQSRMYEAFTQENRTEYASSVGTGLGLVIVKRIVELMGGTIEVESELGKGTKFTVKMILKACDVTEEERTASDETILAGKRALLCEDHPLNATIAIKLLQSKGVVTEHAVNGKVGVEMFSKSEQNYYDVVLMDMKMPEMDGLEATKAIRALNRPDAKTVPIIAMTANAYDIDVQNSIDAGMNAHLAKPIDAGLMFRTICKYLSK